MRSWMISRAGTVISAARPIRSSCRQAIEHAAIVGHQRLHPAWVEHMQRGDDVAIVALLQDVGVAAGQFRQHPAFPELVAGLVVVRPPQHRAECRVGDLVPDVVVVLLDQLQPQLGDVARDQRLAGEVGMKRRCRDVDLHVALPGAGERLAHERIPAAAGACDAASKHRHGLSAEQAAQSRQQRHARALPKIGRRTRHP